MNKGKIKSTEINYGTPSDAMDTQEFERMIKKAESGRFHSMDTVKIELTKWKLKHSK